MKPVDLPLRHFNGRKIPIIPPNMVNLNWTLKLRLTISITIIVDDQKNYFITIQLDTSINFGNSGILKITSCSNISKAQGFDYTAVIMIKTLI